MISYDLIDYLEQNYSGVCYKCKHIDCIRYGDNHPMFFGCKVCNITRRTFMHHFEVFYEARKCAYYEHVERLWR